VTATARLAPGNPLTAEQQRIVEWGDGPLVVIAGAGTGKTRVIVERVRHLLATKGGLGAGDGAGRADGAGAGTGHGTDGQGAAIKPIAPEPTPRHGNPFEGPLVPEQILVLTYNVRAARELQERLDETVGPAIRARMTVTNFHSFCQRIPGGEANWNDLTCSLRGNSRLRLDGDAHASAPSWSPLASFELACTPPMQPRD